MRFASEEEKLACIREKLYTPVLSDTLDGLGYRRQAMRHDIRPLHPDFVVVGDYDGVVVIPRAVEDEALARALAKVDGENHTRVELLQGRLLGEVYAKYGVL